MDQRAAIQTLCRGQVSPDSIDHVEPHSNAVRRVVRVRLGNTRHTVVTVPENLDSHAPAFLQRGELKSDTSINHSFLCAMPGVWLVW